MADNHYFTTCCHVPVSEAKHLLSSWMSKLTTNRLVTAIAGKAGGIATGLKSRPPMTAHSSEAGPRSLPKVKSCSTCVSAVRLLVPPGFGQPSVSSNASKSKKMVQRSNQQGFCGLNRGWDRRHSRSAFDFTNVVNYGPCWCKQATMDMFVHKDRQGIAAKPQDHEMVQAPPKV